MTNKFREEEIGSIGELSTVCSQIVLKCLYLARIGRPDILWSVNKLARSKTKWTKACHKRSARLISDIIIHLNTNNIVMWDTLPNNAGWDCFRTLTFAGDLEDTKSTSGGLLCIFGSQTFVLLIFGNKPSRKHTKNKVQTPNQYNDLELCNDDHVSSNVKSLNPVRLLHIFEDNEAVIKMIIRGRRPTMKHVSRTHRVALDGLFDRINLDPEIQIKYVDILTKRNFTREEWNNLLHLFNISIFSSASCLETMSKRM